MVSAAFPLCKWLAGHHEQSAYSDSYLRVLQIYMHYPYERKVESVIKKSAFEGRGFGAKMTVEQLIAKQTRIERSVYLVYISTVVQ